LRQKQAKKNWDFSHQKVSGENERFLYAVGMLAQEPWLATALLEQG
jgi:hypothetical protein